ncbi:MAG: ABC transporter ATP-binding protein [Neisseriaceae bacterium]|nr:ABC transporter ATP-binding protein [Neisseriaceae bacterium]
MLALEHVYKSYPTRKGMRTVLHDINFSLQKGEKLGILGRNGAGKSTLIRLIGGVESPDSGRIIRNMSVSWPLAFSGAFQGSLTGMDNLRFICRIYNADIAKVKKFTEDFAELGLYLNEPVKTYSSGMKARLAFALSLAIEFDCYLIDEVIAVGDARLNAKCKYELFEKRKDRSLILVSHNEKTIQQYCDKGAVLRDGSLSQLDSVEWSFVEYDK